MGVLEFKGYSVKKMHYDRNSNFTQQNGKIRLNPVIKAKTSRSENEVTVELSVQVGNLDGDDWPFEVMCVAKGDFVYNPSEDDQGMGIDTFIKNNTVAILYPYVRTIITTLTSSSNEFPGVYLPTINVGKMLRHSKEDNSDE